MISVSLRRQIAWLLVVIAIVASCASSAAEPQADPAVDPTAAVAEDGSSRLESLSLARGDYYALFSLLETAQSIRANECMIQLGFEPIPVARPATRTTAVEGGELARLKLDAVTVAEVGYDAAPISAPRPVDPREQIQQQLDPAVFGPDWGEAFYGLGDRGSEVTTEAGAIVVPPGGCFGDAGQQLLDGTTPQAILGKLQSAERFWNDIYAQTEQHPDYLVALTAWSQCLQEQGFEGFSHPLDALEAGMTLRAQQQPEREIDQALADQGCQDETAIMDTYAAAWSDSEARIAATNEAQLFVIWHAENYARLAAEVEAIIANAGL